MPITPLALTETETRLLEKIEFDPLKIKGGSEHVAEVCAAARELAVSLQRRNAVPAHRLRYFTDPEYNVGGNGSSRQEVFVRNARGRDILSSVHFLQYLRYFIYGPDLPAAVIDSFHRSINDCGMVTSGDIIPLGDKAKKLAKVHGVNKKQAAEEFYKLALEHGLQEFEARAIRDRIMKSQ